MPRGGILVTLIRSSSGLRAVMRWARGSNSDGGAAGRMMHLLTLVHRWLGILFCLLFAMWFATGIVMHFVPFPTLNEAERIHGLAPVDPSKVLRSPAEAVKASAIPGVTRLRLFERVDGPVYVLAGT